MGTKRLKFTLVDCKLTPGSTTLTVPVSMLAGKMFQYVNATLDTAAVVDITNAVDTDIGTTVDTVVDTADAVNTVNAIADTAVVVDTTDTVDTTVADTAEAVNIAVAVDTANAGNIAVVELLLLLLHFLAVVPDYRVTVYRVTVHRVTVYRVTVHRVTVHRVTVYHVTVHRVTVYRVTVHRVTVYRVTVHVSLCTVSLCTVSLCTVSLYRVTVYRVTVHRVTVHRVTVHRVTVHRVTVHRVTVYRVTVYRVTVYRVTVYRVTVYRVTVHRVTVHRVTVYRVTVYRVTVRRVTVYRVTVYRVTVYRVTVEANLPPGRRSWRRVQLECRRRKSLKESVALFVALQTIVAVCFFTWEQQQQQQQTWNNSTEAIWRVDKHIVLFAVPSSTQLQDDSQDVQENVFSQAEGPGIAEAALNVTNNEGTTKASEDMRSVVQEAPDSNRGKWYPQRVFLREMESPDKHQRKENFNNNNNKNIGYKHENKEDWSEEEEDPNVGRGFQEEFVTYRADNTFILMDNSGTDQVIANKTHQSTTKQYTAVDVSTGKHVTNILTNSIMKNLVSFSNISVNSYTSQGALGSSEEINYKFKTYNINNPSKFILTDDTRNYFQDIKNSTTCFISGTDMERSKHARDGRCYCLKGYFGVDCGIPEAAWFGMYEVKFPNTLLRRREVPRRVINGLPVNHEFALFEARMHELHDVVDVFIIAESNYTAHGDPKDFHFLARLREGYLKNFQNKIVYVPLGFFPSQSKENGWIADAYLRYYLGEKGLPLLHGLKDDDLFVLSDADELPTREILTFLKVYDGYPEPVSFALRWNMFGFFWMAPVESSWLNWVRGTAEQLTIVTSVATVGMLRKVLFNNVFYIRKKNLWQHHKLAKWLRKYRSEGHPVKDWVAGTVGHYAGWHCSWCFSPENIVRKMDSAQAADLPRWGDFPEKKNLSYIISRIWDGIWFDDEKHYIPVTDTTDRYYAPRYLLDHPHLYRSILFHPGHPLNLNRTWMPP
nr:uncharacterized protein LOC128690154 [Cherax quadricarinatus]